MILLGLQNGSHIKYLNYVKIKSFELIPKDGKLVIDCELKD